MATMKIGRLISPIGVHIAKKHSVEDTQATEDKHQPIAAPNELNYHQRSYFKQTEPLELDQITYVTSRAQRSEEDHKQFKFQMLENQLEGIEKMKSQFEKRKRNEPQTSIDKAANRSIERHNLKPSAVPKITANTSEFTASQAYYNDPEPLFQQPKQRNHPEVIFLDHDSLFEPEALNERQQLNQDAQGDELMRPARNCKCESQYVSFMREAREKLTEVQQKVAQIEHSNVLFQENITRYAQQNNSILSKIAQLQRQRQQARELQEVESNKKSELSSLLRAVKRHDNFTKTGQSVFSKRDKQNIEADSLKKKVSSSKVQCLLQRLQLRIQKS